MLAEAKVAFDDNRIEGKDWAGGLKAKAPFGQMPLYQVGNLVLAQSGAIERFVARTNNLYGGDDLAAAQVDMVSNERVAIHSEGCVVTAIGATNVGSVRLPWEEEISTNVSRRKSVAHAVQRDYKKGPQLKKGDELGWFEFGSCLVLVMDVPLTARCAVAPFSDVRAGEAMYY
jgi:phosphatidylserine decarboxylase precursor